MLPKGRPGCAVILLGHCKWQQRGHLQSPGWHCQASFHLQGGIAHSRGSLSKSSGDPAQNYHGMDVNLKLFLQRSSTPATCIYLGLLCLVPSSYLLRQDGGKAPCPHKVPTDAEGHLDGQRAH